MSREKLDLLMRVGLVFRPGAPVDNYTLFAGRNEQIQKVINAIMQRGQHVIVFGERGVGKTSFANVLSDLFSVDEVSENIQYVRVNCDAQETFSSLWHKIFREMVVFADKKLMGFADKSKPEVFSLQTQLSEEVKPEDIRFILQQLGEINIIVIDELDRVTNKEMIVLLADTIKTLSDHALSTTLILVGVADYIDDLIAEHKSIERALVQIHMPRMSVSEIYEIFEKALDYLEMEIDDDAKELIANLSQGLPHYAHLIGLHATREAIEKDRQQIILEDTSVAIQNAVENAKQSIMSSYHRATTSARKTIYAEVLLACALAKADDLGYFAAADVREPMFKIMGKPYDIPAFARHLKDFCESKRGSILQKTGFKRRYRFRFVNPLMQPFVIMNGLTQEIISQEIFHSLYGDRERVPPNTA